MLMMHSGRSVAALVTGALAALVVYSARRRHQEQRGDFDARSRRPDNRMGQRGSRQPDAGASGGPRDLDDVVERAVEDSFPASDPPASRVIN
jgi:hypothetical protein